MTCRPGTSRRHRRHRLDPVFLGCALLLSVFASLLVAEDAHAYAWMIRHGYAKCETCHTDPSGGELLTNFGRIQSDVTLSQKWTDNTDPGNFSKLLGGINEPDWLRLGGSVRVMTLLLRDGGTPTVFPMQADVYGQMRFGHFVAGGSLGGARIPASGTKHAAAAQLTTNTEGFNLLSRSHYLGLSFDDWLLRIGRLNLPFGIRGTEHTFWTREATRTDRESDQQHGMALAYSGGRIRSEIMLSLGNYQVNPDKFRERGYSGYLEVLITPRIGVGLSSQLLRSQDDRLNPQGLEQVRSANGPMVRATIVKPLVVMGEFDVLTRSRAGVGYTGLVQVDYEPFQGFHVQAVGELVDQGKLDDAAEGTPGEGSPAWGGWLGLAWFPVSHVDVRVDIIGRDNNPFTFQSQAHIYF